MLFREALDVKRSDAWNDCESVTLSLIARQPKLCLWFIPYV
jgi:hypothetical protein